MNKKTQIDQQIAIIGMSARFPGANTVNEYWDNIKNGRDTIKRFTDAELKNANVPQDLIENPLYIKARGILEDVDKFDISAFGISPYEASIMDPQHRVFLEICWEALEVAGYFASKSKMLIGVYAGMGDSSYLLNNLLKNKDFIGSQQNYQTSIATSGHFLATKISYYLDLKGPSVNIQTACSTSLVAIIQACQALASNDCDIALAGGVTIRIPQISGYIYQEGSIYSKDGVCRPFDQNASGTVGSNGAGVVVLKRLEEAIRDGDNIEAVIKGYAINNDGAKKASYTAPSIREQSRCIASALSNVDSESVSYVEAHGTGTYLGDPVEIAALTKAFRHFTNKTNFCAIGSVKSNIGHTDTASGVAGLIKTVLSLKHKFIPPSLHYKEANPHILFSDSPFYVNNELRPWEAINGTRLAAVSSFGIGGTNAHLVLEEAVALIKENQESQLPQLVPLSAKSNSALFKQQELLLNFLTQPENKASNISDIAYTLQVGRKDFSAKKGFVSSSTNQLISELTESLKEHDFSECIKNIKPKLIFLFSGQGTLFPGMAKDLYYSDSKFKNNIDNCLEFLSKDLKKTVYSFLMNDRDTNEYYKSSVVQQISLFILEYSLAKLLISWGIQPDAMMGHSLGEYVAVCISEVLSLEESIELILARGKLTDSIARGSMLSISLSEEKILNLLRGKNISLAAINSPESCVISGLTEDIIKISESLGQGINSNVKHKILNTTHAFHSFMMDQILDEFDIALSKLKFNSPVIPYLSNVTGSWITSDILNVDYFKKHLRGTVLFSNCVQKLIDDGDCLFIEIGVGHALTALVKQHDSSNKVICVNVLPSENEYRTNVNSQWSCLVSAVKACWSNNVAIDWKSYHSASSRRIKLPTYPFERETYWVSPIGGDNETLNESKNPLNQIYEPYWEFLPSQEIRDEIKDRIWLVFTEKNNKFDDFIKKLNGQIIYIYKGVRFEKLSMHSYEINPSSKDQFKKIFDDLNKINIKATHTLYLWNLFQDDASEIALDKIIIEKAYLSLIYFAQVFLNNDTTIRINIITNGTVKINSNDKIIPENSAILGACLIIPQEFDALCRIIDIDHSRISFDDYDMLQEIICNDQFKPEEFYIAYRNKIKFVNKYREHSNENNEISNSLQNNGVYLIIGGLGKIGLVLAKFLAEKYSAHLILTSKTLLNKNIHSSQIDEIKRKAASLTISEVDATNYEEMRNLFKEIKLKYHKLDGIFHLAGAVNLSSRILIKDLTIKDVYEQFSPKVQGAKIIGSLTDTLSPKFCILFSSISSIIGGIGLSCYSAANCILDRFAELYQIESKKTHWITLNWDAWAFNNKTASIRDGITPSIGIKLLEGCLQFKKQNKLIISANNLNKKINENINKNVPSKLPHKDNNMFDVKHQSLEEIISNTFKKCLQVNNINIDDDFYELGGNSLLVIRLLDMLEKSLPFRIKMSDLVHNSSVRKLMNFIKNKEKPLSNSALIKFNDANPNKNVFLIHPVGGTVFCYLELIKHLSGDVTYYGIQDPGIELPSIQFNSISEIASHYLSLIKTIQKHGPFYIGGYSYGGSIAFEIVRQLEKSKEDIGKLFMIDSWGTFSEELKDYSRFHQIMIRTLDEMKNYIPDSHLNKDRLLELTWSRMQLLFKYVPTSLNSKIELFKAKTILPEYQNIDEITNHWTEYSKIPVNVYLIEGDHKTILTDQGVVQIANIMNNFIL